MTREEAIKYIKSADNKGKVVEITFLKADASVRRMNVLVGGDPSVLVNDPIKKPKPRPENIVGVYDNDVKQYRSFDSARLMAVKIDGVETSFPPVTPPKSE